MRGGKRPNAGRKPGSRGKKSLVTPEQAQAIRSGITPLEHMLEVIRTPMPTQMDDEPVEAFIARCKHHIQRQDAMAAAAAPYVHARLASIVTKEDPDQFAQKRGGDDLMEAARRIAFIFATASEEDSHASRH